MLSRSLTYSQDLIAGFSCFTRFLRLVTSAAVCLTTRISFCRQPPSVFVHRVETGLFKSCKDAREEASLLSLLQECARMTGSSAPPLPTPRPPPPNRTPLTIPYLQFPTTTHPLQAETFVIPAVAQDLPPLLLAFIVQGQNHHPAVAPTPSATRSVLPHGSNSFH